MNRLLIFLSVLFLHAYSYATVIEISDEYYGIDVTNRIVVVNYSVSEINSAYPGVNSSVKINDKIFEFEIPVSGIEKGRNYTVSHNGESYTLFFSELPLIKMTTEGPISDSPKVAGSFKLVSHGYSKVASAIGVEYRGASSQMFPKKSMEIEFWSDNAGSETEDVSLLGMREGDSWNLQAMYNEPLKVNSKTANELWLQIHTLYYQSQEPEAKCGISLKYAELFLNGSYQGVYAIGEKVNRKQLKLKKYNKGIKGELYKGATWGGPTFTSLIPYDNKLDVWNGFEYKHPDELIDWNNIYNFVGFVMNSDSATFYGQYRNKFDFSSAVDYFIFLNLTYAEDNTGKNLYTAKYNSGEKYFFVPWDLDDTFGLKWDGTLLNKTTGLLYNGFYTRLWKDKAFKKAVCDRWEVLRQNTITTGHIESLLEQNYSYLKDNGVYQREERVWDDYSYDASNWSYTKSWLSDRIDYLDAQFDYSALTAAVNDTELNASLTIYPNPASDYFLVDFDGESKFSVDVYDFSGRLVLNKLVAPHSEVSVKNLVAGIYVVKVQGERISRSVKMVIE